MPPARRGLRAEPEEFPGLGTARRLPLPDAKGRARDKGLIHEKIMMARACDSGSCISTMTAANRKINWNCSMPVIISNGRDVNYEVAGPQGSPLMAFQPLGASGASIWRRVAAPFQVDYRTVAINPAGYGETALLSASVPMTVRDEAQALAAVIHTEHPDNLGVHVIGHSYGGTTALALACYWPDLVARLTLLEPAPYPLLRAAGEVTFANEISSHRTSCRIAGLSDGGSSHGIVWAGEGGFGSNESIGQGPRGVSGEF